ncbi:MAG: tetratricopeptide repeat protein [Prevotellaceae bacterium]|jgi:tetratricopeptide (TPR) repeat protein|nr:tetratricopeptide repeat protein [Prevotellaceae bacterium]
MKKNYQFYVIGFTFFFALMLLALPTQAKVRSKAKDTAVSQAEKRIFPLTQEEQIFDFYYLEAVRERLAGDYDCSLEMLERCREIDPNNAAVMYELASVYLLKKERDTAVGYLKRAIDLDAGNDWYKLSLAMLYISNNDWKSAGDIYEIILQKHPEDEDIIYYLSQIYSTTGDWQKLIDLLNLHERRYGISEDVSLQKFSAYHFLKKTQKANDEIDALIKAFPNEGKYWVMRGKMYDEEGNGKKALEYYDKALILDPNNGVVYLAYADHYRALGDEERALEYIKMAFRNTNIDEESKIFTLTEFVKNTAQSAEAEAMLEDLFALLLETIPGSLEVHLLYARYLLAVKKTGEAQAQFRRALQIDDKDVEAWYGIVQVDIARNDMQAMLRSAGEALEHLPGNAMFYYYEGVAHTSLKNLEQAIKSYERGLAVADSTDFPQISDLYFGIGEVYRTQNRYTETFESYDKALEANAYNANVLNNYAYTLAEQDLNLDKAEQMAKTSLEMHPNESSILDTYGWIMYRQGFYNLARSYIEKALQNGAEDSQDVWEHLGDVLLKLDEKAAAIEAWQKAAGLEGANTETIKEKILLNSKE